MSNHPTTVGGKYSVVKRLGKGGMGTVFEAITSDTGERVAVKVIAADLAEDASLVTRFQREVRTVSALDTPHIVKVLDAGVDPLTKLPYMAMEYLDGEDLRQLLKRLGPLPADLALRITAQACRALQVAHAAKILHRDIKPANLFLAKKDGQRVVKLLDFGVAKVQKGELNGDAELTGLTRTGSMIGSPLYMSPEQAKGYRNIDGRSDLWSLGVVLYQMLCGRTPHAKIDELGELLVRICTEPPPPIQRRAPWVPPAVAGLLHHALAMSPDDRYAGADALLDSALMLLPSGDAIAEEMLRPLTDGERAIVSEMTSTGPYHILSPSGSGEVPATGFTRSNPAVFPAPGLAKAAAGDSNTRHGATSAGRATGTGTGTGTGGSGSHPSAAHAEVIPGQAQYSTLTHGGTSLVTGTAAAAAPPEKKGVFIAGAALLTGAVAALVFFALARGPAPADGQAAPGNAPQGADSKPRAVKVVVLPRGAQVEVEGTSTEVHDDLFELKGALGSVHKVKVTASGQSRVVEVAITENGPVPAKIEVDVPARPPAPSADPAPFAAPSATSPAVVGGPATFRPKPTAVTTATPAPTPTGRTLRDDR